MAIEAVQVRGYFLEYVDHPTVHRFCGVQRLGGGHCPNCRRPLVLFLTIGMADPALHIRTDLDQIPLLYCWRCNIAQDDFSYSITDARTVEIRKYRRGGVQKDFPYPFYPEWFPERFVKMVPVPADIQEYISAVNCGKVQEYRLPEDIQRFCRPRHQVGGEPILVQGTVEPFPCGCCGRNMKLLAAIADECADPRGFAGNPFAQVIYWFCGECRIVGARQACD